MSYEELLMEADTEGLIVREKTMYSADGRIKGKRIAIRKNNPTVKKHCVLAEEMGHYYTTVGNIIDQSSVTARKQERRSRIWAYNKNVGIQGIINCYISHYTTPFEMADYLGITEEFLQETLEYYSQAYADGYVIDNYSIRFHPNLQIYELVQVIF